MNSWSDFLLIVAIVIGLISAASLQAISVNAISSDALRLRDARPDAPPWFVLENEAQRRRALMPTASPSKAAAAAGIGARGVVEALPAAILDPDSGKPPAH